MKRALLVGGLAAGSMRIASVAAGFGAAIILARGLGPENYGHYAFVVALLTVLAIPVAPAIIQLLTREIALLARKDSWDMIVATIRWARQRILIVSGTVAATVGGYAFWSMNWESEDRATLLLSGLMVLPLMGLTALRCGVLRGLRKIALAQVPDSIVRPGVQLVLLGVLAGLDLLNPLTAIGAFACGVLAGYVISVWLANRSIPRPKNGHERLLNSQHLTRSWANFGLLVAASTLNVQIGILAVGWFAGSSDVAALHIAERASQLVGFSLLVVNIVIGPYIARIYAQGDIGRLRTLSRNSARLAFVVGSVAAIPLLFFADATIEYLFGAAYLEIAKIPVITLALAQLVNLAFGSVGMFLSMTGHERDTLTGQLIALVVTGGLAVVLSPTFGADGGAFAAAIGMILWNVILTYRLRKRLRVYSWIF